MEFGRSPEDEAFRAEVRAWLAANEPDAEPDDGEAKAAYARAWQRRLFEGGWAGITWPEEYGGRGLNVVQQLIFNEEYARAEAPDNLNLKVGLSLVGPTLIHCGAEWQRRRFLPPLLKGDEMWCQGFSEPNSGSDLASLRTRAEPDGDDFVVNGQKIWTSFARWADWCILVARTSSQGSPHRGLTFLLLDMKSPGITIRPLVEMTGHAWFNEVFFDSVRIPRRNVVGEVDKGWNVVMTTLGQERAGTTPYVRLQREHRRLVELAQRTNRNGARAAADPVIRQKLAQFAIEVQALTCTTYRSITAVQRGHSGGREAAIVKLFWSELDQRMKDTAGEILGAFVQLHRDDPRNVDDGFWFHELLWSRAATIYAGTSEIQRNIIAQRVLGLPR